MSARGPTRTSRRVHIGHAGLPADVGAKVIVLATAASTSSESNPISRIR
jgi:hypothetical protein